MTTPTPDEICGLMTDALAGHDCPGINCPRCQAAIQATYRYSEQQATIERLSAALERAEIAMTCGREDSACYCPNCDNSFYGPRDEIRIALGKDAK